MTSTAAASRRLEAGGGGGGDNTISLIIKGNTDGGGGGGLISKEMRHAHAHGRTAHNMSSSSLRKKSDLTLVSKVRCGLLRNLLANLQEIFLGTKLFVLFPAVPLAVVAEYFNFGRAWIFALSLLGLTPLAERVSFLTEQIAYFTGPTVGGLLNATCGNATELIIALFALHRGKIDVVKCTLVGSILSNLLLVLGSSLFCGGLANIRKEQLYDRKQADVNSSLLLLGALCHVLALMFKYAVNSNERKEAVLPTLELSRACSIIMLLAYIAYLFFQLKTHRQLFESQEEDDDQDDVVSEDEPVIGFASALAWLVGMTIVIAVLSEYVVGTIEYDPVMLHASFARLLGHPKVPAKVMKKPFDQLQFFHELVAQVNHKLHGFEATVSEIWYVEEYDVLALALNGRMKVQKFRLGCSQS